MISIIVISGPSGCGKSTLINLFLNENKGIIFSVSCTTRQKRDNEIEGKDYYFINKTQFLKMIKNNEFVEWAEVFGNFYGTCWNEINTKANEGKTLVLDIDVQGAKKVKKKFPGALFIFIIPPNLNELKRRLINRESRVDAEVNRNIKERFKVAKDELKQYKIYDYIVINEKVEDAFFVLNCIYTSFMNSTLMNKSYLKKMLRSKE